MMAQKIRTFTAKIGDATETPHGPGQAPTVERTREVSVMNHGTVIESFRAADDEQAIREQLTKRGFAPGERVGDSIAVTRNAMKPSQVILFVVLIVVILGLAIGWITMIFGGSEKDNAPTQGEAIYACESLVSGQLKSPSSAKFSSQTASGSGASWSSRGTVDSQNSFGAMLRTTYSCTLNYSKSSESWTGVATLNE